VLFFFCILLHNFTRFPSPLLSSPVWYRARTSLPGLILSGHYWSKVKSPLHPPVDDHLIINPFSNFALALARSVCSHTQSPYQRLTSRRIICSSSELVSVLAPVFHCVRFSVWRLRYSISPRSRIRSNTVLLVFFCPDVEVTLKCPFCSSSPVPYLNIQSVV